jgi:acetyl-CoA carboxylase biotin carboxyl carrier protein
MASSQVLPKPHRLTAAGSLPVNSSLSKTAVDTLRVNRCSHILGLNRRCRFTVNKRQLCGESGKRCSHEWYNDPTYFSALKRGAIFVNMKQVVSNMAGVILEFLVKPGEKIAVDQDVVMLESMKMQIPIQSMVDGLVKTIKVNEGDFVDEGAVLLEVE